MVRRFALLVVAAALAACGATPAETVGGGTSTLPATADPALLDQLVAGLGPGQDPFEHGDFDGYRFQASYGGDHPGVSTGELEGSATRRPGAFRLEGQLDGRDFTVVGIGGEQWASTGDTWQVVGEDDLAWMYQLELYPTYAAVAERAGWLLQAGYELVDTEVVLGRSASHLRVGPAEYTGALDGERVAEVWIDGTGLLLRLRQETARSYPTGAGEEVAFRSRSSWELIELGPQPPIERPAPGPVPSTSPPSTSPPLPGGGGITVRPTSPDHP